MLSLHSSSSRFSGSPCFSTVRIASHRSKLQPPPYPLSFHFMAFSHLINHCNFLSTYFLYSHPISSDPTSFFPILKSSFSLPPSLSLSLSLSLLRPHPQFCNFQFSIFRFSIFDFRFSSLFPTTVQHLLRSVFFFFLSLTVTVTVSVSVSVSDILTDQPQA